MTDKKDEIDQWLDNARGGFTTIELQKAFLAVANDENWKNPIDRIVDESQVEILTAAIPWMTGTEATFLPANEPGKIRVKADGYYLGPCN